MKILIATDGSFYAHNAIRSAMQLMRCEGAEVTVLAVAELPITYTDAFAYGAVAIDPGTYQEMCDAYQADAKDALAQARQLLEPAGIPARYELRTGSPAEEVLATARELGADLVVLGSHGRGPIARVFLGSVSEAVLHRWPGASLIVRAATPAPRLPAGKTSRQARAVREVMTAHPLGVTVNSTLQEAAKRMQEADAGFLPVLDGPRLAGVLTDRDIVLRAIVAGGDPRVATVGEFMTREPRRIAPDATCAEAARQMESFKIRRLLVVDAGQVVGVVSLGDLAEAAPDTAEEVLLEVSKSPKTLAHGQTG